MEFRSIHLRYYFNGELISGVLTGCILKWQFETDSNVFRNYIPEGFINHRTLLNSSSDLRIPIIEATLTAIDRIVESVE
jgi:hypothetical protein